MALLKKGASATARNKFGVTALHMASAGGHTDLMDTLINMSAVIDAPTLLGWTPLHDAAADGQGIWMLHNRFMKVFHHCILYCKTPLQARGYPRQPRQPAMKSCVKHLFFTRSVNEEGTPFGAACDASVMPYNSVPHSEAQQENRGCHDAVLCNTHKMLQSRTTIIRSITVS